MIPQQRKIQINKLTEFIASDFSMGNLTLLNEVAYYEDVNHYFDNYEDAFDGMLLYDGKDFHIHINLDLGNRENSKRGRFTFAHELGHFFLDEHRLGLKYGLLEPHASFHNLNQKSKIEIEADYFAACLLMPEKKLRNFSGGRGKKFSLEVITGLSDSFQASILSTVIRFAEIGTHEICAVISQDNHVKWFAKSSNFPNWAFRFKVGQELPPTTVAGEFFKKKDSKFTSVQDLEPNDWFYANWGASRTMHEQCYYSASYGYVISLIWFD